MDWKSQLSAALGCSYPRRASALSVREDLSRLTGCVEDEHVTSGWVSPPPPKTGVQYEAEKYRSGQDAVDQGDPPLGAEDRIAKCRSCARLPRGEREHRYGCQCGPGDAQ